MVYAIQSFGAGPNQLHYVDDLSVIPEPASIGTSKIPGVFYSDGGDGEYKGRVENLFDFILQWDERGQATQSATTGGALRGDNSGGFTLQHVYLDDTQFEVILRAIPPSKGTSHKSSSQTNTT